MQAQLVSQLTGYTTLSHGSTPSTTIADSLCMLQKSYRFDARSGIGQLAKAVNAGSAQRVDLVWQKSSAILKSFLSTVSTTIS